MRGTQIGLAIMLVTMCSEGIMVVESKTGNRKMDGYEQSGYAWSKTILWRGIRSSPSSLWFFYFFLVYGMGMTIMLKLVSAGYAFLATTAVADYPGFKSWTKLVSGTVGSIQAFALGGDLLYMSLAIATLSDVMEAYLVGMVSIQAIMSTPRVPGNKYARCLFTSAFELSAVFGIAMLDSYHALNVLNTTYSIVGGLMIAVIVCTENAPLGLRSSCDVILSLVQMSFSIAAMLLAFRVDGTHRKSMVIILATACAHTGYGFFATLCCETSPEESNAGPN